VASLLYNLTRVPRGNLARTNLPRNPVFRATQLLGQVITRTSSSTNTDQSNSLQKSSKTSLMGSTNGNTDSNYLRFTEDDPIASLLDRNRGWADKQQAETPKLFQDLAHGQHPHILWIGCSDSRVPETTILDLLPGDVFVHRNIANVVGPSDLSLLSVVQYAVEVLMVKHVIVCGIVSLSFAIDCRSLWLRRMYGGNGEHEAWTHRQLASTN
jgi:Carbonic anhydrase